MRHGSPILIALWLLAACAPGSSDARQSEPGRSDAQADPAAMPPPGAFDPPPSTPSGSAAPVQPVSNTAMAITGAATFATETYSFARGQVYRVKPESRVSADVRWSAAGGSWADLLGVDPGGEVELVRVLGQTVDARNAPNGSLCGRGAVRWIAVGRTAEDVGAEVAMAAFSGTRPPGPEGRDEDLCGTFSYAAGN